MTTLQLKNLELHYVREGTGPTVLFIQGVGCKGCVWTPQTDALKDEFDCIRFDNRGMGASTGETSRLTIEQMADDAIDLLDALNIEQAHIVGHSLGGVIAHELALRNRSRVASLALVCTLFRGKDAIIPTWRLIKNGIATTIGTIAMRRRAFARMVSSPQYINETGIETVVEHLSAIFERDLARLPKVVKHQIRALARHDSTNRLHELASIPTIVVAGQDDPIGRPVLGQRLAAAIKTSHFHLIPNASHALPIHKPELMNQLLREHFHRA